MSLKKGKKKKSHIAVEVAHKKTAAHLHASSVKKRRRCRGSDTAPDTDLELNIRSS